MSCKHPRLTPSDLEGIDLAGKDETGKNINMLNLTRYKGKERRATDQHWLRKSSVDPDNFTWNKWGKP